MMMQKILTILFFLILLPTPLLAKTWPEVREFEVTVGFDFSADRFDFTAPIYDQDGVPLYWFICKGGSDAYLDYQSSVSGVNYVGPLSCRLDIENRESGYSLLGSDHRPVWYTRGQFHSRALVGACGNYPEHGTLRHFRLRGFELTMEVKDISLKNEKIDYFILSISVRNDNTISSKRAEQSGYLEPSADCEKIEKGEEELMCRNSEIFAWEECKE